MIKKVVKKVSLNDNSVKADLEYWLSKSPEERIEAVEILRRQFYGDTARLQGVVRVIQQTK